VGLARAWFLLSTAASLLPAAEFTIRTVDGLQRPISGVEVQITCYPVGRILGVFPKRSVSLRYTSDQDGLVHGTYNAKQCKPLLASISKAGYGAYWSGFRDRYVLPRPFSEQEIDRIVKLEGDDLLRELRELLAGSGPTLDPIFRHEARLRPALRTLARDPDVTIAARGLLSAIAMPEDLHFILQLPAPPPVPLGSWEYSVVSALVNPDSEEEWAFLEKCALGKFDTGWPRNGAIQTLRLTGGARSQKLLDQVPRAAVWDNTIVEALDYIKSNPGPLTDPDLDVSAARAAAALGAGSWKGHSEPRFNEAGDKALIDISFESSIYTATFHKVDGVWTLRGAWIAIIR
jgi:hypothetical protein